MDKAKGGIRYGLSYFRNFNNHMCAWVADLQSGHHGAGEIPDGQGV